MEQQSDEQLVKHYLAGDEAAFEKLLSRYVTPIYNFVVRQIGDRTAAQDVSQEVFVKVWRSLAQFDQTKRFKVWLFRIARNSAIDYLRTKKTIPLSQLTDQATGESIADRSADEATLPAQQLRRQETQDEVSDALSLLSRPYRAVLVLYYQEQLNFREIAEITGQSLNSIKSRHRRALALLRRTLDSS